MSDQTTESGKATTDSELAVDDGQPYAKECCQQCGENLDWRENSRAGIIRCYRCRHPENADLPSVIIDELRDIEINVMRVLDHLGTAKTCEQLVNTLKSKCDVTAKVSGIGVDFGRMPGVIVVVNDVTSMATVNIVLREAREAGLVRTKNMKPENSADIGRLTYYYKDAVISFFFRTQSDDDDAEQMSKICRWVKVGTKVVDEMQLVCPDSVMVNPAEYRTEIPDVDDEQ